MDSLVARPHPLAWGTPGDGENQSGEQWKDYCRTCPECQITAPRARYRNPLVPLPIIRVPFERVAMDLPLVKMARGHQYILVIVDYATRYPEVIPLILHKLF
jgi:hypothetical protein